MPDHLLLHIRAMSNVVPKHHQQTITPTPPSQLAPDHPSHPACMQTHYSLHLASLYVSCVACLTYTLLSLNIPIIRPDVNTVLFVPIRWTLYLTTIPAIWWILSHGSNYTIRRKIYIYFLMVVILVSGGLATIPTLSWGHKMYWMSVACVPFPEVCFHLWCAHPCMPGCNRQSHPAT